jgi:hypothetical protein
MKPVNLDNSPCTPQSSNCVIWQGPDIPCIKLCAGDVVTDVIYNLAMELCTILDQLDVKNYDLTCFGITNCGPNDFNALIQFLIDQICALQGVTPTPEKSGSGCPDCIVSTAECFTVKGYPAAMQLLEYVNAIATEICSIIDRLAEIDTVISQLQIDVEYIINNYCQDCNFTIPDASVTCSSLNTAGVVTDSVEIVLSNFLNNVWCDIFDVLIASGNGTNLTTLVNELNPTTCSLSDINTALSLSLSSASTLPEALANIWEILCALKDPITLTAEDTPTIITTLSAGPDYVISSKINDTGWKDLSGFGYMSSNSARPQCRRIGNEVHFRGYITIPMGTTGNGASGTVISAPNPDSYLNEYKGKTFNTVDSSNATDSCLLVSYNDGTWLSGKALKLKFNKGNSVIPSGILGAGQTFDASYTQNTRNIIFRTISVSDNAMSPTYINSVMHTIVSITISNTGQLVVGSILTDESYASATDGIEFSGIGRNLVSNIIAGENVPTFTPTAPSQYNAVASGVYSNSELTASTYTWSHSQNAGDAAELGGFQLRLDGLKAFIDPCDTDVVTYATCS